MIAISASLYLVGCAAPERASISLQDKSGVSEFAGVPIPPPASSISIKEVPTFTQNGIASWYRETGKFKRTADGEKPEPMRFTAAHRFLPFGTIAHVTSMRTGRSVLVRINDRGPFVRKRIIDVSYAAAAILGILGDGLTNVRIDVYRSDQCDVAANPVSCEKITTAVESQRKHKQALRNSKAASK